MMRRSVVAALFAGLLALGVVARPVSADAFPAPNASIQKILDDTNAARAAKGLPPLVLDQKMTTVAQNWSNKQRGDRRMYHNPNYSKQIPSGWRSAAENVAYGYPVDKVVKAWMESPGHRANILGDFTSIGIGYSGGYYTQVFAKYPGVKPPAMSVTASTAGKKPINQTTYVWGKVRGAANATVSTEVLVNGKWSRSQVGKAKADGSYTLPLTYGANKIGTYRFRVKAVSGSKTVYSAQFTLTRTR